MLLCYRQWGALFEKGASGSGEEKAWYILISLAQGCSEVASVELNSVTTSVNIVQYAAGVRQMVSNRWHKQKPLRTCSIYDSS
jgi:hypothetical protein